MVIILSFTTYSSGLIKVHTEIQRRTTLLIKCINQCMLSKRTHIRLRRISLV